MRLSRLKRGLCNERLIQQAYKKHGVAPAYYVLEQGEISKEREFYWFKRVKKVYGADDCMNICRAGFDVSSAPNREVHKRISKAIKKFAKTPKGRAINLKSLTKAHQARRIQVKVGKITYESKAAVARVFDTTEASVRRWIARGSLLDGTSIFEIRRS